MPPRPPRLTRSIAQPWRRQANTTPFAAAHSSFSYSSSYPQPLNVANLLARPSWSVRSLLPNTSTDVIPVAITQNVPQNNITADRLCHLLRLSALPRPATPANEAALLSILHTQLYFVQDIQHVDITGFAPLQAIRDETTTAVQEQTVTIKSLEPTLLQEEAFGHNRRPRRRPRPMANKWDLAEDWDILNFAPRTAGRYIVVTRRENR